MFHYKKIFNNKKTLIIILSFLFALSVQKNFLFQGSDVLLINSIKSLNFEKLSSDWVSTYTDHIPVYTYFNYLLINLFSINIINLILISILVLCSYSLFYINNYFYNKLNSENIFLWFAFFLFIFHEKSFFSGVAGQSILSHVYAPSIYGVLMFSSFAFFLYNRYFLSIFILVLAVYFHPTYLIHSFFLFIGYIFYLIKNTKTKQLLIYSFFYAILIFPVVAYIYLNFLVDDKLVSVMAREILVYKRIPHHANINVWLSSKDFQSLAIIIFALYLIRSNKKIFIPLSVVFGFSFSLSIIQYFIASNSLALAFPWRSSVFLMPLSSLLIFTYFLQSSNNYHARYKYYYMLTFLIVASIFFIKSNLYLNDDNKNFKKKEPLYIYLKGKNKEIDKLLLPLNINDIRLNTGIPIFVSWKYHPFKNSEILDWDKRINLNKTFYSTTNFRNKIKTLETINILDAISHFVIFKESDNNNFREICNKYFNYKKYFIYDYKSCNFTRLKNR